MNFKNSMPNEKSWTQKATSYMTYPGSTPSYPSFLVCKSKILIVAALGIMTLKLANM